MNKCEKFCEKYYEKCYDKFYEKYYDKCYEKCYDKYYEVILRNFVKSHLALNESSSKYKRQRDSRCLEYEILFYIKKSLSNLTFKYKK